MIQQRRDTFEYIEFIQGIWTDVDDIPRLFTLMSNEERDRIRNYTFKELWEDMWINKNAKMYKDCYEKAKQKYESVYDMLANILDNTKSETVEPPWNFPKGRKSSYTEKDYDCAIRETEEETRIPKSIYNTNPIGSPKFNERFQGSNGKGYSTTYFLCEFKKPYVPELLDATNGIRKKALSEEAHKILWVPYKEACKYLNSRRQTMLREALTSIKQRKKIYPKIDDRVNV